MSCWVISCHRIISPEILYREGGILVKIILCVVLVLVFFSTLGAALPGEFVHPLAIPACAGGELSCKQPAFYYLGGILTPFLDVSIHCLGPCTH